MRVLATWNRRPPAAPLPTPANARVVDWFSYARTMPAGDVVVCHGGHGTVVRALSCGGAGGRLPGGRRHERERGPGRLGRRRRARAAPAGQPLTVRLAVTRALEDASIGRAAHRLAAWAAGHDAGARAATLVERMVG